MSSPWKFWGGGEKKTKNENTSTPTADEKKSEQTVVPPSGQQQQRDRKDRNMSISRSGRHKYRNKQRCSVMREDLYGEGSGGRVMTADSSSDAPQGACQQAERNSLTRLRGSLVMASQPTVI